MGGLRRLVILIVKRRWVLMAVLLYLFFQTAVISGVLVPALGNPDGPILIDAGHGGIDGGTTFSGVVEKEITLDIAIRVKGILDSRGLPAALIRDTDTDLSRWGGSEGGRQRRDLAGRVRRAKAHRGSVFLSIHVNSNRSSRERGGMIFYKEGSAESRRLADLVYGHLSKSHPAGSMKPRVGDFYVVRNSRTPAVLVEVGFMSNDQDRSLLRTAEHRRVLAEALASALVEYHGQTSQASR